MSAPGQGGPVGRFLTAVLLFLVGAGYRIARWIRKQEGSRR